MPKNNIKVMVVDDSVLIRKYVSTIINSIDGLEVITTAPNGKIALKKLFLYKPDFITLDIEMPEMNGIEFLKYLKEHVKPDLCPPIIVLSSIVGGNSSTTFEALANGAKDFIKKPEGRIADNLEHLKKEFELKISALLNQKTLSKSIATPVIKSEDKPEDSLEDLKTKYHTREGLVNVQMIKSEKPINPQIVAIGSSTGGPNAIRVILQDLKILPVPVVIAQHMPAEFTQEFAKNLAHIYKREVVEAYDGLVLKQGAIYVCPGGFHSRIRKENGQLTFYVDKKEYEGFFFKPSVDLFFESIQKACGKKTLAVVLSGMGKDSSVASVPLRKQGAIVFAQNRQSSVVWGMPGSAFKNGGVDLILDINEVGTAINQVFE